MTVDDRARGGAPPLDVVAFTGGTDVPSARFRVRQFVPALHALGVRVTEWPARRGTYPPAGRWRRPAWAVRTLASRLRDLARVPRGGVTLLQRELVSTLVTLEPLTPRPRVLDVDDAIWIWGGEAFARRLAGLCDRVVCGNAFLAEQFGRWHPRVEVLPTAVDTARFAPGAAADAARAPIVGWSGSASTLPHLHAIERPLAEVLRRHPDARLRVVCDRPPRLPALADRVEFVRWSPDAEVRAIREMSIGLMPLDDTVAARGKCSLKMLLYMACGVPVVVSPVGTNAEVLARGAVGRGARTDDDWVDAVDELLRDSGRRRALGECGREIVEREFSVRALAPRLAAILRDAAG